MSAATRAAQPQLFSAPRKIKILRERLMMSFPRVGWAAAAMAAALLAGCAQAVRTEPVKLAPVAGHATQVIRLEREAQIVLDTGYKRSLRADSRWRNVGSVAQGQVYRPLDSVLTIEGRQVHEAYLVISGGKVVGFYLPGESNYTALGVPVTLFIGETQ